MFHYHNITVNMLHKILSLKITVTRLLTFVFDNIPIALSSSNTIKSNTSTEKQ